MSAFPPSLQWADAHAPVRSGHESALATRGKGLWQGRRHFGWLPLAGSLCIAIGYAVIVTYILKALVDSLVGTPHDGRHSRMVRRVLVDADVGRSVPHHSRLPERC